MFPIEEVCVPLNPKICGVVKIDQNGHNIVVIVGVNGIYGGLSPYISHSILKFRALWPEVPSVVGGHHCLHHTQP